MSKTRTGRPGSNTRSARRSLVELTAAASHAVDDGLFVLSSGIATFNARSEHTGEKTFGLIQKVSIGHPACQSTARNSWFAKSETGSQWKGNLVSHHPLAGGDIQTNLKCVSRPHFMGVLVDRQNAPKSRSRGPPMKQARKLPPSRNRNRVSFLGILARMFRRCKRCGGPVSTFCPRETSGNAPGAAPRRSRVQVRLSLWYRDQGESRADTSISGPHPGIRITRWRD
jgi:hypothetical protein